jgi:uncharacterized Ntn-hydrolase superfamily protein
VTFSIAARCARTGQFGIAIASSSPAVAARCAHARAGIGAVCSQNITDPALGALLLDALAAGASAAEAIAQVVAARPQIAYRQLTAIDRAGGTGHFSGAHALGLHAAQAGLDAVAAGNLLARPGVPAAMIAAFEAAPGDLPGRLVGALAAGLAGGGEAGPVHSAGLLVVDRLSWPLVDLRIDWHEADPIGALAALWARYRPQTQAYVDRALDPAAAPRFGVPGDP